MNKKIGIFMVFVLLVGAVFLSACDQEAVGRNLKSVEGGGVNQNEMVDLGDEGNLNKVTRMEQRPYTCMCASGTCTGTETTITSENEDGGWARSTTTDCGCCGDKAKD